MMELSGKIGLMKQLRGILSSLQDLNDNWNDRYWIYVGGGTLYLMRYDENGEHGMLDHGGIDPGYIVESFVKIEADGGGW